MIDPIQELKIRAERLHKEVSSAAPNALLRLRALPEFRRQLPRDLAAAAAQIRRKHCLAIVAREVGFESWAHASAVLGGETAEGVADFGTLLCPPSLSAHWNIWSASYEEAQAIRKEHGGYLLAYKRHYLIVDRHYLESLGLDPDDADWDRMARDWVRPAEPEARRRLYGKLLTAVPPG